jgi:hypothetical protein
MGAAEEPVHLAGAILGEHRHICAFFNNAAEGYWLETYLQEGRFDCERMLRSITGHAEWRTHPMVILGGVLQVNPFFVTPDQYLHELREWRMARQAESSDPG